MNLKLLVVVLLLAYGNITAQTYYQFSNKSEQYVSLSGATTLNVEPWDIWDEFEIPMPFPVFVFGKEIETLVLNGGTLGGNFKNDLSAFYGIIPNTAELIDAGYPWDGTSPAQGTTLSPLKYIIEGGIGNRILKVEVNNAISVAEMESLETNLMQVNYQVWFYEDTESIEVRYGSNSITDFDLFFSRDDDDIDSPPFTVALIEIKLTLDFIDGEMVWDINIENLELLEGTAANPQLISDQGLASDGLSTYPITGQVFVFDKTLSTSSFTEVDLHIYPNPTADLLWITNREQGLEQEDLFYEIFNSIGQKVKTGIRGFDQAIDVRELQSGVYFIKTSKTKAEKFIKK